ncbi:MAG TPA: hypothetical protein VFX22_11705 [Candidatus Kapabacteria bacterium]|nr:hypothetical protein [Candidatus Kapabacteria bacterium]
MLLSATAFVRSAVAQYGSAFDSPRSFALGRAAISDPTDEWSSNAAIRADTNSHVRVLLSPDPILPGSLSAGVSGDVPLDASMTLGASFSSYEYGDAFSWQSYSAQTSKTFLVSGSGDQARYASAGIRLRYVQQKYITDANFYIPSDDLTGDLGATFDLFPQLTAGVAVTHLLSISYNQPVPIEERSAWLGLTYRPLSDLTLEAAMESPTGSPTVMHFGAEYAFDANLFIRAGAITGIGDISAGIGVITGSLIADFTAVEHTTLGTSLSFGIAFVL